MSQGGTKIPGMITDDEQKLLRSITEPGDRVTELGCFLGLSTSCFLEAGASVNSYDLFRWEQYMDKPWYRDRSDKPPEVGWSFIHLTHKFLASYTGSTLHDVNLAQYRGPVFDCDILFVDAIKAHYIGENVVPLFFRTAQKYVIDQDFFWNPSLYMYMWVWYYKMRQYLEPCMVVDSTLVFKVIQPLPLTHLERYTFDEVRATVDYFGDVLVGYV